MTVELPVWPYVYGLPSGYGKLRSIPEDFVVEEILKFEPSGTGEHVFLQIQKAGENTEYIVRQLAKFANVRQRDIGYAGLKDRHAITTQWFSVWLPGRPNPEWSVFETEKVKVLQCVRHSRKLKRGVLSGNRFKITLRDWHGDLLETTQKLQLIRTNGIANYYGEQRFGYLGQNVGKAQEMFNGANAGREQRSLYLSAVRSYLFNHILGKRVASGSWNKPLAGDTYMMDRSKSFFKTDLPDTEIIRRLDMHDIHPTGVLWGKGDIDISADAFVIEHEIICQYQALADGLVKAGVEKARRALRVKVDDLKWQFINPNALQLSFVLPAGCYATSVLREVIIPD